MLYSLKFNLGMTFKREEKKSQRRKEGKFYGAVTSEREAQIGFLGGGGLKNEKTWEAAKTKINRGTCNYVSQYQRRC